MDERELRRRFHRAFDGVSPSPGFFERAMGAPPEHRPPAIWSRAMTGLLVAAGLVLIAGVGIALRAHPFLTDRAPLTSATPSSPNAIGVPERRDAAAVAYDAARQVVVMFGGMGRNGWLNDTWIWDGANWREQSLARAPSRRAGAAMAFDPATRQTVLFGGSSGNDKLGDTWTWDGKNWTQQHPATSPPPRIHHALAYDQARGTLVLFGGNSVGGLNLRDTWIWDGKTWIEQHPSNRPPGDGGVRMVSDGRTVLLFTAGPGGPTTGSGLVNETWMWDGSGWTRLSTSDSPSPTRFGVSMAYDAKRQEVVLFGGYWGGGRTGGTLNDTWTWVGKTWVPQRPPVSPRPAELLGGTPSIVYDSARERIVLFINGETWLWDGKTWASVDAAARVTGGKGPAAFSSAPVPKI